jgi:hypothetical protein
VSPRRRRRALLAWSVGAALILSGCSGLGQAPPSAPVCRDRNSVLILLAQAVPSASFIPCITEFPVGWTFGGEAIRSGQARFWLDSDRAGSRAVTVTLSRSCDTSRTMRIPVEPDEAGTARFEQPKALRPHLFWNRYYTFKGGCVTYRFAFRPGAGSTEILEATSALTFFSRARGVTLLRAEGLELCGAGVSCPG